MRGCQVLALLVVVLASCGATVETSSIDIRVVRAVGANDLSGCPTCQLRRLHFFDGTDRAILVEKEPVLRVGRANVRSLVATEMRTMAEPHITYWEVRALLRDSARARVREVIDRFPGERILTDVGGKWFAISDTDLLHEALVVARVAHKSEAIDLSLAIGAPTEWHELDEEEWLRDKVRLEEMLEDESSSSGD
jgi:hypothetical protein